MSKDLDFSSRIIYEVQKYPVIWDSRHPHHLNRQILGNAWYSISTILQKPENLCKQRWRSLKERYQKSIRAVQQSGGDRELAAIKTSSNSFFEQLSFLQSNSADANIPDNREDMSESVTATAFDSERLSKPNPIELDEELNTESPPFSPSNTSQSESNGPKPKKSKQQVEIVEKSILQRKKQVRNEDDEVSSYARYLSLAISTLKPKNQLLVRHKFEEILFEVKMSELEEQQCGQVFST